MSKKKKIKKDSDYEVVISNAELGALRRIVKIAKKVGTPDFETLGMDGYSIGETELEAALRHLSQIKRKQK